MAKRKARGFAGGGLIVGRGTGASDDIQRRVPVGSYIMPAAVTEEVGADALDQMGADVLVSNGEYQIPPEQVMAVGIKTLDAIRGDDSVRGFHGRPTFAKGGPVLPYETRRMLEDTQEGAKVRQRARADADAFRAAEARSADQASQATRQATAQAAETQAARQAVDRTAAKGVARMTRGTAALTAIPEALDVSRVAMDPGSTKLDVATQAAEGAGRLGAAASGAAAGAKLGAKIGKYGGPYARYTVPAGALIGGVAGGAAGAFGYNKLVGAGRRAAGVDERSPSVRLDEFPVLQPDQQIDQQPAQQPPERRPPVAPAPQPATQQTAGDQGAQAVDQAVVPRGLQSESNVRALGNLFASTREFGEGSQATDDTSRGFSGGMRDTGLAAWQQHMRERGNFGLRNKGRAGRAQQRLDLIRQELAQRQNAANALSDDVAMRWTRPDVARIDQQQSAPQQASGMDQLESAFINAYQNAETQQDRDRILGQIQALKGGQQDLRKNFMKVSVPVDPNDPLKGSREELVDLRNMQRQGEEAPVDTLKDGTPVSSLKDGEAIVVPDKDTNTLRRFIMRNGQLIDEGTGKPVAWGAS